MLKKNIPNFITSLNLICGGIAIPFALNANYEAVFYLVFAGMFFDFFDGLVARKLKVSSEMGVQLDSFSDLVTFGLVPSLVMINLIFTSISPNYVFISSFEEVLRNHTAIALVSFSALLIAVGSAFRLATFNISSTPSDYFQGLPTPANGLFFVGLPLLFFNQTVVSFSFISTQHQYLVALVLFSVYLMNSKLRMLSLKNAKKHVAPLLILGILSVLLIVVFKLASAPLIVLAYVLISRVYFTFKK